MILRLLELLINVLEGFDKLSLTPNCYLRRLDKAVAREGLKRKARRADSSSARGLGAKSPTSIFLRGHANTVFYLYNIHITITQGVNL